MNDFFNILFGNSDEKEADDSEEAIEITVAGEIVNFQNKTSSQLHNKTQKITRKGSVY